VSRTPFSSVERTLHEIDSDASGFGHRTSRRVDSRADTGCGLPEGCSGRRGGGAPCGSSRFVGGWCRLCHWAPRGKQTRALTCRAGPNGWRQQSARLHRPGCHLSRPLKHRSSPRDVTRPEVPRSEAKPAILAGAHHPLRPTAPGTLCRHRGFPRTEMLKANARSPASRGAAAGDPARGPGRHVLSGCSRNSGDSDRRSLLAPVPQPRLYFARFWIWRNAVLRRLCRRQLDASSRYWVSGFIHHPSARARITARKEVGMRPVLLWFLGISVSVIILPYLFYAVYQWR
jgi:hypothetical protein